MQWVIGYMCHKKNIFQKLLDISKQKKKLSPYEKLREEIIEYFDSMFK